MMLKSTWLEDHLKPGTSGLRPPVLHSRVEGLSREPFLSRVPQGYGLLHSAHTEGIKKKQQEPKKTKGVKESQGESRRVKVPQRDLRS